MKKRRLASWIDGYKELHKDTSAPEISCHWAGLFTVAAALERRTWVFTDGRYLYPNLYVFVVSPPGIGKTAAMTKSSSMLRALGGGRRIGASSCTSASLVDDLRETTRSFTDAKTQKATSYNSLALSSNDLQVLLPSYDTMLLGKLTELYDCYFYDETRRGKKEENSFELDNPQLSLYAATTPGHLMSTFDEAAWGLGFMSRTIMVFTSERRIKSLFSGKPKNNEKLEADLKHDLKIISEMQGEIFFAPEAAEAMDAWHQTGPYGGKPIPTHPRLTNYCTRRTAHLLKLCINACVDRGDCDMIISLTDWERALDWLLQAESTVHEIFKEAVAGSDMTLAQDLQYFLLERQAKAEPTKKGQALQFLMRRTTAVRAEQMLSSMKTAGLVTFKKFDDVGMCVVPQSSEFD